MIDTIGRQLVFDLSREPCFGSDNFLVSAANAAAVAAISLWPDWPSRMLLLVGPAGSGKSHLAAAWAAEVGATRIRLGEGVPTALHEGNGRSVLMEDCDRRGAAEAMFFHTLNLIGETKGWLLMTARSGPSTWGLTTPDLLSRLRLAQLATIDAPDAELLKAVLVKLFADRQIMIDEDVVSYAARHCEQSLDSISRFVATVDEAALASGRRITRPLAAETIANLKTNALD